MGGVVNGGGEGCGVCDGNQLADVDQLWLHHARGFGNHYIVLGTPEGTWQGLEEVELLPCDLTARPCSPAARIPAPVMVAEKATWNCTAK